MEKSSNVSQEFTIIAVSLLHTILLYFSPLLILFYFICNYYYACASHIQGLIFILCIFESDENDASFHLIPLSIIIKEKYKNLTI